jgi:uncharacterized membrane protein HdeD (DUF308 family)
MTSTNRLAPERPEAVARVVLLASGLVGLAVGIFVIVDPHRTLRWLSLVFGIFLVVWGATRLYHVPRDEGRVDRGESVFLGLLGVAAGLVVLLDPGRTLRSVAWAFGIYLIAVGVVTLVRGQPESAEHQTTNALIDIAAGAVALVWPKTSLWILALILGIYLLVRGVLSISLALAWSPRHLSQTARSTPPSPT